MICRECKHAVVGDTKGDKQMAAMGYRSCSQAKSEVERATYVRGSQQCMWPERVNKS